jgi:hypothetical protein
MHDSISLFGPWYGYNIKKNWYCRPLTVGGVDIFVIFGFNGINGINGIELRKSARSRTASGLKVDSTNELVRLWVSRFGIFWLAWWVVADEQPEMNELIRLKISHEKIHGLFSDFSKNILDTTYLVFAVWYWHFFIDNDNYR